MHIKGLYGKNAQKNKDLVTVVVFFNFYEK